MFVFGLVLSEGTVPAERGRETMRDHERRETMRDHERKRDHERRETMREERP